MRPVYGKFAFYNPVSPLTEHLLIRCVKEPRQMV